MANTGSRTNSIAQHSLSSTAGHSLSALDSGTSPSISVCKHRPPDLVRPIDGSILGPRDCKARNQTKHKSSPGKHLACLHSPLPPNCSARLPPSPAAKGRWRISPKACLTVRVSWTVVTVAQICRGTPRPTSLSPCSAIWVQQVGTLSTRLQKYTSTIFGSPRCPHSRTSRLTSGRPLALAASHPHRASSSSPVCPRPAHTPRGGLSPSPISLLFA